MLHIVCVNAGNYEGRGAEYVNVLFDMVRRNLAEGHQGEFVCFTDDPKGIDESIKVRALPKGLNGWWNKLYLFKAELFPKGDRILYFDLDTLITGRLDEIAAYDGEFAILRDFYRQDGWQSSVMAWRAGFGSHLWDLFEEQKYPDVQGGDQAWIEQHQDQADILQDSFPGLFVSYKVSGINNKASVVCFHGKPRPHEVIDGLVPKIWKVGGYTRGELDNICNTENALIHGNIKAAISLNLPTLRPFPDHTGRACIIGGGPSLVNKVEEIKLMKQAGARVWALNNTHDWLIEHGIVPDACFILDARPENAEFVKHARDDVTYYIASQCHPDVYNALSGKRICVFHNATEGAQEVIEPITTGDLHLIGGGTTVGMKAIAIARFTGYRSIHLYGMDSCYMDSQGHAYPQDLNANDRILNVHCEGRDFNCAPWMVTQANDFIELAGMLIEQDCVVTIAGDGLLAQIAKGLMKPVVRAADIRAFEILKRIKTENPVGAEIGVYTGDLSVRLLSRPDLTLNMVDSWAGDGQGYNGESGDWHSRLSQKQQDDYYRKTLSRVDRIARARVIRKPSIEAAKDIPDESLDFVFIDADHSYAGCKSDILAWYPKVKKGGLFGGHDYENTEFKEFGVTQAVNEFTQGKNLDLGENFTWFITKEAQHAKS